jgi:glucokinase
MRLRREKAYVGVDLGGTKLFGAVVMPDGSLGQPTRLDHDRDDPMPETGLSPEERSAGATYARLAGLVDALTAHAEAQGLSVGGIGVGAPGITRRDGVVVSAPALGWEDLPLGGLLSARMKRPTLVENDVNLTALGENAVGAGRGVRSLFCLAIGTGMGGAVVLDGRLWRGRHSAAGEIGALVPGPEYLGWSNREWGALEGVASGSGISEEARRRARAAGVELSDEQARTDRVFAAADSGAPWAREVVHRTVDLWCVALSAVQAILDPEVIVVSGGVAPAVEAAKERIEDRLSRLMRFRPRIVCSDLGYKAAVLGVPALFGAQPDEGRVSAVR